MISKKDFKNALINLNNAQLLKEQEIKVYIKRIECYLKMSQERKINEELDTIKQIIISFSTLDQSLNKHLKHLLSLCRTYNVTSSQLSDLLAALTAHHPSSQDLLLDSFTQVV